MNRNHDLFGKNLKRIRLEQNLDQKALAEISGVTNVNISLYEHGHSIPTLYSALQIADALAVKITDLTESDKCDT